MICDYSDSDFSYQSNFLMNIELILISFIKEAYFANHKNNFCDVSIIIYHFISNNINDNTIWDATLIQYIKHK